MSKIPAEKKKILVLEDDADIAMIFSHFLIEATPYEPVLLADPHEALEVVKTLTPALFILNYNLPGMNGVDLYDRLHAQRDLAHVPAIMVSANLLQTMLAKRGIVGLEKPFDFSHFIAMVTQLVG